MKNQAGAAEKLLPFCVRGHFDCVISTESGWPILSGFMERVGYRVERDRSPQPRPTLCHLDRSCRALCDSAVERPASPTTAARPATTRFLYTLPSRAFSLLPGFPERLCSGVFFTENAHKGCGVGLHPQGKCSILYTLSILNQELPKAYDPALIEEKWAKYWVEERLFDVPTPASPDDVKNPFVQLLPPPNVTGRLHMGHMLNQTEMDILTRWHRMLGDTAVWIPGTDHAGIATQMMVERQLAAEGTTTREQLGREAFTERVWEWKHQYGNAITDQMRRLGASVDWSREYFTMDERLSKAVKEAFVRLYEQGLIYRGAYIVNWDPVLKTAVSDLEVTHEERAGKLYHIRYPLADGTGSIVIATTRPETMLGDVAVAVNPSDERYTALIGKMLKLPLSAAAGKPDREIPVVADDWANPEFGTGAVKVTPAHDPNDFAIGQRHNLPQPNILDESAHIKLAGSPYDGMDRYAARERIVADLESSGALVAVKDHTHAIALSQRTGVVIEPRLSMQWFLAVNKIPTSDVSSRPESAHFADADVSSRPEPAHLAGAVERPASPVAARNSIAANAIAAVRDGHIKFTPEMYSKTYFEWMNNIHDWCISRQLWWGHRIPAWHCGACNKITVSLDTPGACSGCGITDIKQETDVLDTWFSWGLLPFTVFGWPGHRD